jgi:thermitase
VTKHASLVTALLLSFILSLDLLVSGTAAKEPESGAAAWIAQCPKEVCVADTIPSDSLFASQYGPQRIHAPTAWDTTTGASSTRIAIVDTGVDCTHPDIASKCEPGYDFINNRALTGAENSDDYGHGTHVAGIAAAVTNNATGVAGVCWACRVMPIKVLDSAGSGTWAQVAAGINYAWQNGANIINMSLGGSTFDSGVQQAVNDAWSHGVLVVAACGNAGGSPCSYPGAYLNSLAVTCTDQSDLICSFSSRGNEADIAAPGYGVISAVPTGICSLCDPSGYKTLSGTSMSTPHVAETAGLIWATFGGSNVTVRSRLQTYADDLGASGFDICYGNGRVNAYRALSGTVQTDSGGTACPAAVPTPRRPRLLGLHQATTTLLTR